MSSASLAHAEDLCLAACRAHAEQAAQPLLRMVVHTVLAVSSCSVQALDSQLPDPSTKQPYLEAQIARLKICKRLLLAMQASFAKASADLGSEPCMPAVSASIWIHDRPCAPRPDLQVDGSLRSYVTNFSSYPSHVQSSASPAVGRLCEGDRWEFAT